MFWNNSTHQSSSRTIFLDIPRKWASLFLCAAAATLLTANCAFATILVGSESTPGVETIPEMNALIDAYNTDFGASLPQVVSLLDKIEDIKDPNGVVIGADFIEGNLVLGDFNFFQEDLGGGISLDIFDSIGHKFSPSNLGPDGFDTLDENVHAFEQLSGPSSTYYVSKDGKKGWSLWVSMDGVNPVYTDQFAGGFTRGDISDNSLAFDPAKGGVSHISFYTAVPEPGTLLLGALASLGMLLRRRY
jgi:hypothetical protein